MIISLLLGLASMIVALLGLKCIKIGSATDQSKAKVAVSGGVLSMLAGLCCMTSVSWYAYRVVQDFHNPFFGGVVCNKFELSTGLYMGWGGACLAILGGGFLCSACKRMNPEGKKSGLYGAKAPRVYTATAKSDPDSGRAYFFVLNHLHEHADSASSRTTMSPRSVVFKKLCKDKSVRTRRLWTGALTVGVYLGRRDFVDHVDHVDPVAMSRELKGLNSKYLFAPLDGVVLVDPVALQGRKVFVTLSCTFRYGRDDVDVMGIAFRRELYLCTRQVYPPLLDREEGMHTQTQAKLLRKLGDHAYPFFFEFPDNLPCSVALQPAPHDVGKQCAVEFEVTAFSAESRDAKTHKR
ncbi:S-arrestin [Liparis tanakae]|uniref:S-arrestin n=1 Tax=Liparis tanakae TaxID=230148 RepID=A0A4Z2EK63_9TELE|nr:S-arrestin [Liparis tanakae]